MQSQRGQTATEYLGIIVVITAIVGVLVTSGFGERILGGISTAICEISGGSDCGAAAADDEAEAADLPVGAELDGDGPEDGPPLQNGIGTFPVLPFPGAASGTCTVSTDPASARCAGSQEPFDAGVRINGTVTRSEDRLNPRGCPVTTVGVSGAFEAYGNAEVDGAVAGAGVELYGGVGTTYQVTTSPERADAYADTPGDLPNPLDPSTLAVGEGIQMSQSYYAGLGLSGQYRVLQASMGYEQGRELSTGVTRIDAETVRIYAGDSDYVSNALQLGIGTDDARLYLGGSTRFSEGDMTAIDVDISTPEGWAAYQAFAESGELPPAGAAGTANPTDSDTISMSGESRIGAAIGNVDASLLLGDWTGTRTDTTNADDSVTTFVDSRQNDVGLQIIRTVDADGDPVGTPTYGLNFNDVDPSIVEAYQMVNGLPQTDTDGTLRLEYTTSDLNDIQIQAVDQIRATFLENGPQSDVPSRQEVLDQLAGNPYAAVENADGVQIAPDTLQATLAAAESPEEVLVALSNAGMGNGSAAVNELTYFALDTDQARNDDIPADSFPLDPGNALPGTPVTPSCG